MVKLKKKVAPTLRDGGNISVIVFTQIIFNWILVDLAGLNMPREVAGAIGGLVGYIAARYLRY